MSRLTDWTRAVMSARGPACTSCRLLLMGLALFMDHDTLEAWPSTMTLAEVTAMKPRTVSRHVQEAVNHGWLRVSPPGHAGRLSRTFWGVAKLATPRQSGDPCRQYGDTPRQIGDPCRQKQQGGSPKTTPGVADLATKHSKEHPKEQGEAPDLGQDAGAVAEAETLLATSLGNDWQRGRLTAWVALKRRGLPVSDQDEASFVKAFAEVNALAAAKQNNLPRGPW